MSSPQTINIVTQPSNDKAVITAAKIGFLATIIAALIVALASLLGAVLLFIANWQQKIECCWIQKDDWKQVARENGWIPRSECPWASIPTTGHDNGGKNVKVLIHLLAGEYRWVYTSSSEAEIGENKIDLPSYIRGLEINPRSKVIVAVGMASVEGDFVGQSVLSEERTDVLIDLIKKELKPTVPVHGLSLGRYIDETTKSNPRATSDQRRIVIVEVLEIEEGAVLREAVYDALIEARNASEPIPFDVRKYRDRNYTDHDFGRK